MSHLEDNMIEQLIEGLKTAIAGITPEMVLEWIKVILVVISQFVVIMGIPVAFIMVVHSIRIFALQCAFSGPRLSRFATLSMIVSYTMGVGSIYGTSFNNAIGHQIEEGYEGLIHIINGHYDNLNVTFCILAAIVIFATLFTVVEAVKTIFSKRRVIDAYDEERIGKAVIAHRVHFILYVIILFAAIVYSANFSLPF